MPPTVSVQGWGLTVYENSLCHPPPEPVRLLVEYGYVLAGERMRSLTEMLADGGRLLLTVFRDPLLKLSPGLTYIRSRAVTAFDMVYKSRLVFLRDLVLGMYKVLPYGRGGLC